MDYPEKQAIGLYRHQTGECGLVNLKPRSPDPQCGVASDGRIPNRIENLTKQNCSNPDYICCYATLDYGASPTSQICI